MSPNEERSINWWGFAITVVVSIVVAWLVISIRKSAQLLGPTEEYAAIAATLPEWWWSHGNLHDWLLVGPDAGNWAANARAWMEGSSLDSHRLPAYTALAATAGERFGDVVFGGHMVNHYISCATALVALAIGVAAGGVAVGAGAALLTALSPELVNNQLLYGVDPTFQFAAALLALSTLLAVRAPAKSPWALILSLAVGCCAGLAAATHYLGLVFAPVALVTLTLLRPLGGRRWIGLALALAATAGLWVFATSRYSDLTITQIFSIFTQGVAGSDGRVTGPAHMSDGQAAGIVAANLWSAPGLAIQRGLRSLAVGLIPWSLLMGLFWVGLADLRGLTPGAPFRPRDVRWRAGLTLLFILTPLIALEAARAPDRYALFSRPLIFVVVVNGIGNVARAAALVISRLGGLRKAGGLLGHALSAAAILWYVAAMRPPFEQRWELRPPLGEGMVDREISVAISSALPSSRGVVTTSQAIPFYTGMPACPTSQCLPGGPQQNAQCIYRILRECSGSGPIPYLVVSSLNAGLGNQPLTELDTLIGERFETLSTARTRNYSVTAYALERPALRQLGEELASQGQGGAALTP